jgi:hypothetical protein
MGSSRTKPLTIKEIEALAAERPRTLRHHVLGGVPGSARFGTIQIELESSVTTHAVLTAG